MKRGKELLKNTLIIAIGKFSTKLISFFLLPLYTSLLTTTDYGTYDLLVTISTFLIPVITLLMEESMFRFLIDCKNDSDKKEIISQTILFTFMSTLFFTIIYIIVGLFINIPYKDLFFFYIISNIIIGLRNAVTRGTGKIKLFSISCFITSLITIVLNVLFIVKLKLGVSSLLISSIIANTITTLYVFISIKFHKYVFPIKYSKTKTKEMIKYSIPLVPNSLSWAVVNLSDRIVVSSFMGTSANGIYSVSYKFPNLMDTIYNFFYTAWKESAAKAVKDKDSNEFYNKVYDALKNFMWAVVILMIAILPFIYSFFVKKDFIQSYLYVPVLILAMYFSNISGYYGGIFSAHKDTKIMGTTTFVAAIINLVVDVVFIKYIGIWAAAISTLISTLSVYVYRRIKLKKYVNLNENYVNLVLSWISVIIAFALYYYDNFILRIVCLILLLVYVIYINKNGIFLLKNIKKQVKS